VRMGARTRMSQRGGRRTPCHTRRACPSARGGSVRRPPFQLPSSGAHPLFPLNSNYRCAAFAFLTSIVNAAGHTRAPFPSASSTAPSAPRRPCCGARGTLVRPFPRLHRWPLFSCLVPPATSLSSYHATPQLRCTLSCYASPPWLSRDSQGRRQRLDWTGIGAFTRARMGGPRCMSR